MAYQYIANKTSYLYENANDGKWSMVLIYGDEVEVTGYRGAPGSADQDREHGSGQELGPGREKEALGLARKTRASEVLGARLER